MCYHILKNNERIINNFFKYYYDNTNMFLKMYYKCNTISDENVIKK